MGVAKDIIAKEGFGALYRGLGAGLLRQATYTTARLGIFNLLTGACCMRLGPPRQGQRMRTRCRASAAHRGNMPSVVWDMLCLGERAGAAGAAPLWA